MQDVQPFAGFEDAAQAVLTELRGRLDVEAAVLVRADGDGYRVVHAAGPEDRFTPGTEVPWPEACAALLEGAGPQVSGDRSGTVAGAPVLREDGSVYGLLLAVDPADRPELAAERSLVEVLARLLATVLAAAVRAEELTRWAERVPTGQELSFREGAGASGDGDATSSPSGGPDGLAGRDRSGSDTQLFGTLPRAAHLALAGRRAWEQAVRTEEARCRRYGNAAAIVVVDLEAALLHGAPTDDLLQRSAAVVESMTRSHDLVAWLGRTQLGVLAVECDAAALEVLTTRIRAALEGIEVEATITGAVRPPDGTLQQAWEQVETGGETEQARA